MTHDNPTVRARRRYIVRFTIAMIAYALVVLTTVLLVKRLEVHGIARYLLLAAPLVPLGFLVPVLIQYLRETDEFERRIQLESLAIAGGVTAALSVTYGFLESAGLPHPSAWWTWIVVMGTWGAARCFVSRQYQ
jgi:hypothetical protein